MGRGWQRVPEPQFGPRFSINQQIGSGGFGSVFEAFDHERQAVVALKRLKISNATAIHRFKQEFRSLADMVHPNLVRLYEFFSLSNELFFTMELLDGVSFRNYVTMADLQAASNTLPGYADASTIAARRPAERSDHDEPPPPEVRFSEERLRAVLPDLVKGVLALHRAGKLHRDLKPPNVLVTSDQRVVILDFGLVAGVGPAEPETPGQIFGTPAYMAPEQACGEPATEASDWYAVGVMLYDAMVGRPPFAGSAAEMLVNKVKRAPPNPRDFHPELPRDLCDLAMDLLSRNPKDRPSGADLVRRLGLSEEAGTVDLSEQPIFVGRTEELATLKACWRDAHEQRQVTLVLGDSGVGKSALVERFLEELSAGRERPPSVLRGRCFEQETVPYKAIDGVIDALAHLLRRRRLEGDEVPLPIDLPALARMFPVLGELEGPANARPAPLDPLELRRRAVSVLRDIVTTLGQPDPLVVFIDDLQWGDAASIQLLVEVTAPPNPPPLLLLLCARDERCEALDRLRQQLPPLEIDLAPLELEESTELAQQLLCDATPSRVLHVARESHGSPLFLFELARFVREGADAAQAVSLQRVLSSRLAALSPPSRSLMNTIAIAGGPVALAAACQSAALGGRDALDARAALRSAKMVRIIRDRDGERAETSHDSIREAVLAELDEATKVELHAALAVELERSGTADPETLFRHFSAGQNREKSRRYAEVAGDRAAEALLFDHAAKLYRRAIELEPPETSAPLWEKLGDALGAAGRGLAAAEAYQSAVAKGADPADLRRRAAEQLLRTGHVDDGIRVAQQVTEELGLGYRQTVAAAFASLLIHRARLKMRGLEFELLKDEDVPREALTRIDACWALGNGLGGIDLVRAADFQAQHMRLALDAGDGYRIARAFAWEAILRAVEGGPSFETAHDLTERSERLAQEIAHPHAFAWAVAASAVTSWCQGHFRTCVQLSEYGTALFRERCDNISWEVASLECWWALPARYYLGEIGLMAEQAPLVIQEATERGDLYGLTLARTYVMPRLLLALDRPAEARAESSEAISRWTQSAWHFQHWNDLIAQAEADLYEGAPERCLERLEGSWRRIARSQQLRSVAVRIQTFDLRGRAALAVALRAKQDRAKMMRLVERSARRLDKCGVEWAALAAERLRAGMLLADGDHERARDRLQRAMAGFEELEMPLYAAAVMRLLGRLTGGDEGETMVTEAVARAERAEVKAPERLLSSLVPGVET